MIKKDMKEEKINYYRELIERLMFIIFIFIGVSLSQINEIIAGILFLIWGCILGSWTACIYSKIYELKIKGVKK